LWDIHAYGMAKGRPVYGILDRFDFLARKPFPDERPFMEQARHLAAALPTRKLKETNLPEISRVPTKPHRKSERTALRGSRRTLEVLS
jgi:hypothetical protein